MDARHDLGGRPLDAAELLDKLAGLRQVISPEQVRQAIRAAGLPRQRRCLLNHEVLLWVVLAMGLLTDLPIR